MYVLWTQWPARGKPLLCKTGHLLKPVSVLRLSGSKILFGMNYNRAPPGLRQVNTSVIRHLTPVLSTHHLRISSSLCFLLQMARFVGPMPKANRLELKCKILKLRFLWKDLLLKYKYAHSGSVSHFHQPFLRLVAESLYLSLRRELQTS